eukprot:NODE_5414_length_1018_cov_46.821229_g4845_i0.p1 GENE.NODE_5414_length_1018_cov_46.821229_g4845_i0~~NODE_5414_length_1018_cov_46.821229_g4845_i0.p1  ORF type:complete len:285 (-),score=28.43 NODE_5414_length_1018_cov_46.821229_g4845_i0:87-941(-)
MLSIGEKTPLLKSVLSRKRNKKDDYIIEMVTLGHLSKLCSNLLQIILSYFSLLELNQICLINKRMFTIATSNSLWMPLLYKPVSDPSYYRQWNLFTRLSNWRLVYIEMHKRPPPPYRWSVIFISFVGWLDFLSDIAVSVLVYKIGAWPWLTISTPSLVLAPLLLCIVSHRLGYFETPWDYIITITPLRLIYDALMYTYYHTKHARYWMSADQFTYVERLWQYHLYFLILGKQLQSVFEAAPQSMIQIYLLGFLNFHPLAIISVSISFISLWCALLSPDAVQLPE